MMACDKLRLLSPGHPSQEFFDAINADFSRPPDQRTRFNFTRLRRFGHTGEDIKDCIGLHDEVQVSTKQGVTPTFFVWMNMIAPGGKKPPQTVIECNPNNFRDGFAGLCGLVDWILGPDCGDLTISREDLNAELDAIAVQFCFESVRVRRKRKSSEIGCLWKNRGVETFEVGKLPSQLVVYDKRGEQKVKGADVTKLPPVLTRFEWRFQHDHCPVRMFSEFAKLRDIHPFSAIEFLSVPYYDFKTDPLGSWRRLGFEAAVKKLGAQDAYRVANLSRNFKRDFRELVVNVTELPARLSESYQASLDRFFANKCSNVQAMYGDC